MYMYVHTSNETIQFMVKFVDNNYRAFQKERRAKGKRASILSEHAHAVTDLGLTYSSAALTPHDQSIHEFNKYVSCICVHVCLCSF